ncbi:hypothetical protein RFI_35187, partial [Reticulomyxa filosa]
EKEKKKKKKKKYVHIICVYATWTEFINYCSLLIHPLLLEFHFKCAMEQLGAKVDIHDGPLPAVHTECSESVLVPVHLNSPKRSQRREQLYDSESEKGEEEDEEDDDEEIFSDTESGRDDPPLPQRRRKFIGIWQPKVKVTPQDIFSFQ